MEFMEFSVKLKDIGRDDVQFPGNHGVQVLISAALNAPVNTDMNPPAGQDAGVAKGDEQFAGCPTNKNGNKTLMPISSMLIRKDAVEPLTYVPLTYGEKLKLT